MKHGIVLATDDAVEAVQLACEAEEAGWDGIFLAEVIYGMDPWVTLGACAAVTSRVRLGTMLTPPSRRRPWKLASETLTVDHLSRGRVILSVGLGALDVGFANVGEAVDKRERAQLLDESLDIITALWSGHPVDYRGQHYTVTPIEFPSPAPPVQQPRIPIWCVGAWGRSRSMRRALRCDGLLPNIITPAGTGKPENPTQLREIARFIEGEKGGRPYDLIMEGTSPPRPDEAARVVEPWREAGATWWIESDWSCFGSDEGVTRLRERVTAGPPRA